MIKLKNEELQRKTIDEFQQSEKAPFVIVLDNVRSLMNIGSVFRTSDAFMVESVYLCGIAGIPPNKEISKTALGAENSVSWKYFQTTMDAINILRVQGYTIISIEQVQGSIELQDFKIENDKKYAIIFGHEIKGVAQEVVDASDFCVEIPQFGTKHSFNISVSAGIALWEFYNKYLQLKA